MIIDNSINIPQQQTDLVFSNQDSRTSSPASRQRKRQNGFKALLVSGVGFLADAYDLFVIDFVLAILTATAYEEPTTGERGMIVSATLAGAVVGQLGFGFLADFIGRRVMFITTAGLCILGSLVSAVVGIGYQNSAQSFSVFNQLAAVRFLLGLGIGGEYPLAATVTSEIDNEMDEFEPVTGWRFFFKQKPNSIATIFSMQGLGMLLSPILVMLLIKIGASLEMTWRFCLAIGALPSAVAFFFRWGIHESASFQKAKRAISLADSEDFAAISDSQPTTSASPISSLSIMNISSATTDAWPRPVSSSTSHKLSQSSKKQAAVTKKTKCGLLPSTCSVRKISLHLKRSYNTLKRFYCVLIGTSLTWFLIDVTFYGTGSFKSEVVDEMFQLSASRRLGTFSGRSEGIYRQLEFPSSVRQLQRDVLREILGSFISINQPLRCQSNSTNIEPESRPSYVAAALRSLVVVDEGETRNKLFVEAIRGSIVACLAIPGYILSVLFIHKTGLRNLTFWGFWGVALAFFVLGGEQLLKLNIVVLELILFGLTFLATNFGPNSTTFILPTAVYPTAIRATCHGFSAAMGKLGGVVGTNLFGPVDNALGLAWLQILCGVIAVLGAVVTYFFIPSDEKAKESIELYDLDLALKSNRNREARLTRSTSHVISIKNFNS